MTHCYDLIILGGGCAGLSLATNLICSKSKLSVLILEQRISYVNDRTWCYFSDNTSPRSDIQHRWPYMRVASDDANVVIDCSSHPYEMVNAERFYNNAQAVIENSASVKLKLGVTVHEGLEKHCALWSVSSDIGVFKSRYIVDTRPARQPRRDGAKLWQSFYGAEIECETGEFNVLCGDLMDFSAAVACGSRRVLPKAVCFVYVLPTSHRKALIEFTAFGPDPLLPKDLDQLLQQAITHRLSGSAYTVLRQEHGVLPMGIKSTKSHNDPSHISAGLTAGAARASSGYAFTRIQRWALCCAQSLTAGDGPVKHVQDSFVQKFMDSLFLKLVRLRPDLAPYLFVSLFSGTDTQSMIRFLSDRALLTDHVRVIASLLPGPLFKALFVRKPSKTN